MIITGSSDRIEIFNPTKYPASVKMYIDDKIEEPLSQTFLLKAKVVDLQPGETKRMKINKA